ncbi:MAG: four helix bundle protein [Ignavibacteriae bacterium]|nr:four helix bundle protein [Ignavibacteriota bacterium]
MESSIKKFEDLIVWQEAMLLVEMIYSNMKNCKDFGLRDQMQRSSVSVPSNIAEGFERKTNKEFIQYLFIAKGSCGELRTQIYLAVKVGIISAESGDGLIEQSKKVSAMLYKLIKTRKEKF